MDNKAKVARLYSAIVMLTEVIEDLEKIDEPTLTRDVRDIQKRLSKRRKELKGADKKPEFNNLAFGEG